MWFGDNEDPATPTLDLCPRSFPLQKNQVTTEDQLVTTAEPTIPRGTYPAEGDAILLQDDGRDERHLVP